MRASDTIVLLYALGVAFLVLLQVQGVPVTTLREGLNVTVTTGNQTARQTNERKSPVDGGIWKGIVKSSDDFSDGIIGLFTDPKRAWESLTRPFRKPREFWAQVKAYSREHKKETFGYVVGTGLQVAMPIVLFRALPIRAAQKVGAASFAKEVAISLPMGVGFQMIGHGSSSKNSSSHASSARTFPVKNNTIKAPV